MNTDETADDPMPDATASSELEMQEVPTVMSDSKVEKGDVTMSDAKAWTSVTQAESTAITAFGTPFSDTTYENSEASPKSPKRVKIDDVAKEVPFNPQYALSSLVMSVDILLSSPNFVTRLLSSKKLRLIIPPGVVGQVDRMSRATEEGSSQAREALHLIDEAIKTRQPLSIQSQGHNLSGQWQPGLADALMGTTAGSDDPAGPDQVIGVALQVLGAQRDELQKTFPGRDLPRTDQYPVILSESPELQMLSREHGVLAIGIPVAERLYFPEGSA
jgi:hypothetical protein